jgi:phytoene dehydrogenase-like protein
VAEYDAVVVGAGPNGLSAAVEIARNGGSVLVLEAADTVGGGCRTQELTRRGFKHDVCSAIHPMAAASPFFNSLPLADHGLEWILPPVQIGHPLDDGPAVLVHQSLDQTADELGDDARAYHKLFDPLVRHADKIARGFLGPLLRIPRNPFAMARFGLRALPSAEKYLNSRFKGERAKGMLAGNAAHALQQLDRPLTMGFALIYNIFAHSVGWPYPRGGSQAIPDALASYFMTLGGRIECGTPVKTFADIPSARAVLFDLSPRQIVEIAGDELPARYRRKLEDFKYGPAVFKIDWALSEPIPWKGEGASQAGCLHLGGTLNEIAESERRTAAGEHAERPWVILAQQSLFDPTRAPRGKHTAWSYCHVPNGSTVDMTEVIEAQLERFAPGFRDTIVGRSTKTAAELEAYNPNYVGGDIASGMASLGQIVGRPVMSPSPHKTPNKKIYICSQSAAPGPGVHGMCGYFAAQAALRRLG